VITSAALFMISVFLGFVIDDDRRPTLHLQLRRCFCLQAQGEHSREQRGF
jgi:hypothetical protein